MVQHDRLTEVLHELAAIVNDDFTVDDAARVLLSAVPRVLDVDGAGISVVDQDGLMRFVQGTSGPVDELDRIQETLQAGPCQDSRHQGRTVAVDDIAASGPWPQAYLDQAREAGFQAVTTFPLQARDRVWGALDLYRVRAAALSDDEIATGQALAHVATGFLALAADREALREAQQELTRRAMYDALTGLPMRWVLVDHVDRALSALRRTAGHVGVLFIDLDGLKFVNDNHGHAAGDHLIRSSADALQRTVRPSDVVARVGGDEFVVLLPGLTDPGTAEEVAARVLDALATAARTAGTTLRGRGASVGVTTTDDPAASADTLISHADAAMYQAKRAGGGRHAVFDPETYAALTARQRLIEELAAALEEEQLELHYQPIVELPGGEVTGVEALLRWRHPDRGLLTAGEFLAVVEGTDLAGDIGAWVFRAACRQLAAWDETIPDASPRRLFVNVSAGELAHPGIDDRIRRALELGGVAGERLVIEVTETEAMTHAHTAAVVDRVRRELGCGAAIDDFGTGHSSFSRLAQLPADIVKIDQSFTGRLFTTREVKPIVSALIHLGDQLDREVIVEGIEDAASCAALVALGCRYGQGYHLGRPQPPDELAETLTRGPAC